MKKTIVVVLALAGTTFAADLTLNGTAIQIPNTGFKSDFAECAAQVLGQTGWTSGTLYGGATGAAANKIDNWADYEAKYVTSTSFNIYGRSVIGGETMVGACVLTGNPISSTITLKMTTVGYADLTYTVQFGIVAKSADGIFSVVASDTSTSSLTSAAVGSTSAVTLSATAAADYEYAANTTYYSVFRITGKGTSGTGYNTVDITSWKATTVPEPSTATLSLLALAGLCVRRRRR